jgi:hypothetical protein
MIAKDTDSRTNTTITELGLLILVTFLFLLFSISGCSAKANIPADEFSVLDDSMPVVEMYWKERNIEDIVERTKKLSELVAGNELDETDLRKALSANKQLNHWILPFKYDAPNLTVKVIPEYDEIRVINKGLVDRVGNKYIPEKAAIRIAKTYLEELSRLNLINREMYSTDNLQVGYGRVGEGAKDNKYQKTENTIEYRITFRPNIQGIQLANAGVRISIHRSGEILSIRLGGVSLEKWDGKAVERKVSSEKIREVFRQSIPLDAQPIVAWSRPMYVMPEDMRRAVVEPLQIFSYSLKTVSDGKYEVISRRKIFGFSFADPEAKVIDFTPPAKKHSSTELERS